MKVKSALFLFTVIVIFIVTTGQPAHAQQYKLRQATSMSGMKSDVQNKKVSGKFDGKQMKRLKEH